MKNDMEDVIVLRKVITYDGQEYRELKLDLDALTGQDLIDAGKELVAADNNFAPLKEFDKGYLSILAARAADIPTDMMPMLSAKDFTKITLQVQNFLLNEE